MRVHDPWLLLFAVSWILVCYAPITITNRRTREPIGWRDKIIFSGIGWAILLHWYSLK